jgi:hypothetical protein
VPVNAKKFKKVGGPGQSHGGLHVDAVSTPISLRPTSRLLDAGQASVRPRCDPASRLAVAVVRG